MKLAISLIKEEVARLERSLRLTHENGKARVQTQLDEANESLIVLTNLSNI